MACLLIVEVHGMASAARVGVLDRAVLRVHEGGGGVLPAGGVAPQHQAVLFVAVGSLHLLLQEQIPDVSVHAGGARGGGGSKGQEIFAVCRG